MAIIGAFKAAKYFGAALGGKRKRQRKNPSQRYVAKQDEGNPAREDPIFCVVDHLQSLRSKQHTPESLPL